MKAAWAEAVYDHGIDAITPILNEPMALQYAMKNAERLLAEAAEQIMRIYRVSRSGFC